MQIRKEDKSSCKNIDEWNKRNEYILQNISDFIIVGIWLYMQVESNEGKTLGGRIKLTIIQYITHKIFYVFSYIEIKERECINLTFVHSIFSL